MKTDTPAITVCALYKFVRLEDFTALRQPLLDVLSENDIRGTLLLADEGINGTVAGSSDAINTMLEWLQADARLSGFDYKLSYTDEMPFRRTRVKLKKEIVTMGVEGIDPNRSVGTYCNAKQWNALLNDPDVLLIDTRNDYEFQVGTFRNAVNPKTEAFREFPRYVKEHLEPHRHKKIAMFCTGGIRCEKSTAYLKEQGFDEVYHLKGGILKYLETMPEEDSLWQGECFVFDERVTVDHKLEKGGYAQCNACRMPITAEQQQSEHFEQGVSCPHCHDKHSPQQKARFAEREKQMRLAQQRGQAHLGGDAQMSMQENRELKLRRKEQQRSREKSQLS